MRNIFPENAPIGSPTAAILGKRASQYALRAVATDRRTLAFHLEILALGWTCGFAAGAGLLAMILR